MKKTVYQRPAMEKLGSFETLTKSTQTGTRLDAAFSTGTPLEDLTLS